MKKFLYEQIENRSRELQLTAAKLKKMELQNPIKLKMRINKFPSSSSELKKLIEKTSQLKISGLSGVYIFEIPMNYRTKAIKELEQYRKKQAKKELNFRKATPKSNPHHSSSSVLYVGMRGKGALLSRILQHLGDPPTRTGALRLSRWLTNSNPSMILELTIYPFVDSNLDLIRDVEKAIWTGLKPLCGRL